MVQYDTICFLLSLPYTISTYKNLFLSSLRAILANSKCKVLRTIQLIYYHFFISKYLHFYFNFVNLSIVDSVDFLSYMTHHKALK